VAVPIATLASPAPEGVGLNAMVSRYGMCANVALARSPHSPRMQTYPLTCEFSVGARGFEPLASSASRKAYPSSTSRTQSRGGMDCSGSRSQPDFSR
jgi:hypothetical protein